MSFNRSRIGFAYDPCTITFQGSTPQTFDFSSTTRGTPTPGYRFLEDSFAEKIVPLSDNQSKVYVLNNRPLRNVELMFPQLDRLNALKYRLFRQNGYPVTLFPNYSGDTCVLTHFENNLASEIGITALYQDVSGVTFTPTYGAGPIGYGVNVDYCATRVKRILYDQTLTAANTISFWMKVSTAPPANLALFSATAASGDPLYGARHTATQIIFDGGAAQAFTAARGSAGTWHHYAFAKSGGTVGVYFDGAYLGDATCSVTFGARWALGNHSSYDCSASSYDEARFDAVALTANQIGALYDRANEQDELALAEQTQGHYFRIPADPMQPASLAQANLMAGRLVCQGLWSDANQRVAGASYA